MVDDAAPTGDVIILLLHLRVERTPRWTWMWFFAVARPGSGRGAALQRYVFSVQPYRSLAVSLTPRFSEMTPRSNRSLIVMHRWPSR
jgi:hypothetical protein